MNTAIGPIHARLADTLDADIARISEFVRQPSVSPERRGIPACAELVAANLRRCGCDEAGVIDPGDGFPGAWGRLAGGKAKTMLVYSHFDTRPAGPAESWTHDPFSGAVTGFAGFGRVVMGRGAGTKAPLQAWLNAVSAIRHVAGELPVNLVFLIEGAEIMGSPNFPALAEARRADLAGVTALYGPRATQDAAGVVTMALGYKGLIYLELTASGAAWGRGPVVAVHSATNAVVDSPAWRLARALATLVDESGAIAVPALQDATRTRKPIAEWERRLLAPLAERLQAVGPDRVIPGLNPQHPIPVFRNGAQGAALLEDYLYGPSMNLNGLRAGYTGPGSRTFLLPADATATLDIRVVSDRPAGELIAGMRAHLDAAGFPDIAINVFGAYDWNQTAPDSDLVRATADTLAKYGCRSTVWPMQAFGGPWAHYARALGVPALFGSAPGHGGNAVGSDEYFVLDGTDKVAGLLELERYFVDLMFAYADLKS